MPQPSITKIGQKNTYLKFHSNLPGASELSTMYCVITQYVVVNELDQASDPLI